MTIYIKDFRFSSSFGKNEIKFSYYTGDKWKKLTIPNKFERENIAVYTRYVFDEVKKDLCLGETDTIKKNDILREFESKIMCLQQLNPHLFDGAAKLFS